MHDRYVNPLCTRYAGRTMQHIYSDDNKFSTWRRLWVALAESEQELGLPITDEQIQELRAHITDIDYDYAAAREHEVRHDVMAHVLTYGARGLCRGAHGGADARLPALTGRAPDDRRQARHALDAGPADGS